MLSMTFGRPPAIPNDFVKMPLPLNQNLDNMAQADTTLMSNMVPDLSDTVCLFTATTYVG